MAQSEPCVHVTYTREGGSETFSGDVSAGVIWTAVFDGFTWEQVLGLASEALQRAPGLRLVLKRGEAPYPMTLPDGIEDLLRRDLSAAIAALTIGPQRVVIGGPRRVIVEGLRHGHDTLADALGDVVYLKVRPCEPTHLTQGWQVESPVTGRWTESINLTLSPVLGGRWVTAQTEDVLALGCPRYYLPRRWNEGRGWISRLALVELYELYRKEKSDVTDR